MQFSQLFEDYHVVLYLGKQYQGGVLGCFGPSSGALTLG
jgi:hypothetical protein